MIHIKAYSKHFKDAWNAFNRDSKNGLFMFDRDFMEYHSHRFVDHSLLFFHNDSLIALLPCNIYDNVLYSHQGLTFGGFIINTNMRQALMLACFDSLRDYMRDNGLHRLIYKVVPYVYHRYPAQEDLYALFFYNARLSKIECSSTIMFKHALKISDSRKGGIKKAMKMGIDIKCSSDFDSFIELLNEVLLLRHDRVAVHNANELRLLHSRFPNNLQLWLAKAEDRIIAGALLFIYEDIVHTQYLASNDYGKKTGALDLLIYSIMDAYKDSKAYLDFGISNENDGKYLNEGLIFQKEGFGARSITHVVFALDSDNAMNKNTLGGGGAICKFCPACSLTLSAKEAA